MSPKPKAVILARVSSKGQEEEGYSLDSQVKLLKSYCETKELAVAQIFKITESASKASQRRTFKEAMKFIADDKIKHLIIEKVDRHVRNLHDAVETHDWLMADENKRVHFVKTPSLCTRILGPRNGSTEASASSCPKTISTTCAKKP